MFSGLRAVCFSPAVAVQCRNVGNRFLSTNVTAALVKELRTKSGAPMMDCKKALLAEGVDGDVAKAIDYLRVKGLAKASANTRTAAEGLIGYYSNGDKATMVEVNCETDFVNNNELFQDFVANVASTSHGAGLGELNVDTLMTSDCAQGDNKKLNDALGDIVSAIRENIIVRRATNVQAQERQVISAYMHGKVAHDHGADGMLMGSKLGVVVLGAAGDDSAAQRPHLEEAGKRLAMHVVAAMPAYLDKDSVPNDVLEAETAICREQTEANSAGKKPEIVEKMITGKLSKRLSEICLMDQNHMAEDGNPVISKYIAGLSTSLKTEVRLHGFYLWHVGQTVSSATATGGEEGTSQ